MDLGGGQAGPIGVDHGFHHVIDQTANFRRLGSETGLAGVARMGWPMRAIFRIAMAEI
jgi:hypothetical protein